MRWNGMLRSHRPGRAALAAACLAAALGAASAAPPVVKDHKPIGPDEHPRLIFRGAEALQALRAKAGTEWGKAVVYRMVQTRKVMDKASIIGRNREVIKEAGFKAAGDGAACVLQGDASYADLAKRVLVIEVVHYPLRSRVPLMDRACRLHGTALAYDLCYGAWDAATRGKIEGFLREEIDAVLAAAEKPGGSAPDTVTRMVAYCAAGIAELAILRDPSDAGARRRIEACEAAVGAYLGGSVTERGFGHEGESVKQAVFAAGIVPFVIADKLVLGRDLTGHAAIRNALTPTVYLTVPDAGMPIIGEKTAAADRSGLFAMATDLADAEARPAVAHVFRQVGGEKYCGVVRPHHALYMLAGGLDAVARAAPSGDAWPGLYVSKPAKLMVFRSAWKDVNDVVTLVHDGRLRLLGMGARWLSTAGLHAAMWSDSTGAGALDNVFGFNTLINRGPWIKREYGVRVSHKLEKVEPSADGRAVTATTRFTGEVTRRRIDRKPSGKPPTKAQLAAQERLDAENPVGKAVPFTGSRHVLVDYSGRCGAPVVMVISDRLTGGGKAPREWVMHLGALSKFTRQGPVLAVTDNGVTFRAAIVAPAGAAWAGDSNPKYINFGHIATDGDVVRVVLTLGRGEPPKVRFDGAVLTVGPQAVRFDADRPIVGT